MQRHITTHELFSAISEGNAAIVQDYLSQIDATNPIEIETFHSLRREDDVSRMTPLLAAASSGHTEITKIIFNFFVSSGLAESRRVAFDLETDSDGKTALICAAMASNMPIVKMFVESRFMDVTLKDNHHKTAAVHANKQQARDISDYLVTAEDHVESQRNLRLAEFARLIGGRYGDMKSIRKLHDPEFARVVREDEVNRKKKRA